MQLQCQCSFNVSLRTVYVALDENQEGSLLQIETMAANDQYYLCNVNRRAEVRWTTIQSQFQSPIMFIVFVLY